MTRARDLAVTYPTLSTDAPAADVVRILAEEPVDAVFVEHRGQLQGVVTDLGLLRRLLPSYVLEDPALAQVLEEGAADLLWQRLDGHTAAELPTKRAEVAQVDDDATLLEVAAAMVRARAPLMAVRDRDGRLLGGITTSRLLTRLLGAPQ